VFHISVFRFHSSTIHFIFLSLEIDKRSRGEKYSGATNAIASVGEKGDPIQFADEEIFVKQHGHASQIAKGIGQIDEEACIAGVFEGGNEAFEKDAVEGNVAGVGTKTCEDNPPHRTDAFVVKQPCGSAHHERPKGYDDVVDHQGPHIVAL
jgi:hypothetical protein